eukprot:CAMPEP_0197185058 /NCGR_PEP_ID=MMETSP1423-20130617/11115_1 /TAXON_ID=476441 /ORGANISM="Pseudo-nitzschia heimii, Strain UNC1101" /LENGTH=315 /DNA_ID=CAMNT_0042636021 /DNA_START=104 /DNA_END=1048 /DNA_ORIENTATION=-
MITRNIRIAAAIGFVALDCTISNGFVRSFSAMATAASRNSRTTGWTAAGPTQNTQRSGTTTPPTNPSTTTSLCMGGGGGVRTRGLEKRREGPTPTEGGMVLYLKAAEDGKSVGDCPFAHYIRLILEEKGLPYTVEPCAGPDDKPNWLLDYYEGKLPCLRHKKEAYVESNVIAAYLDYFFPSQAKPSPESKAALDAAEEALVGFFPAVAGYLKDVEGDGDESAESLANLRDKLSALEGHLGDSGGYLDLSGDEETFGVLDCRLVPQLYHLAVGIEKFKRGMPDLEREFPKTQDYLTRSMARQSFQNSRYSPETIEW